MKQALGFALEPLELLPLRNGPGGRGVPGATTARK
jgi:hypothetical protein